MKTADCIFDAAEIHSGFSADGAVGHADKGCRHCDKIDPAHVHGGSKPAHIADNSSSETEQHVRTGGIAIQKKSKNALHCFNPLILLACRNNKAENVNPECAESGGYILKKKRRNIAVRQNKHSAAGQETANFIAEFVKRCSDEHFILRTFAAGVENYALHTDFPSKTRLSKSGINAMPLSAVGFLHLS